MDTTEHFHAHPVRVLRHAFEPSEPVVNQVQGLFETAESVQKLRFFATKIAVLDGVNYYNSVYHADVTKQIDDFAQNNSRVLLSGAVGIRRVDQTHARLAFQPLQQPQFNQLLRHFDTLKNVGDEVRDARFAKHYLYTDVAINALLQDKERLRAAMDAFKNTVASTEQRHLYYFRPLRIVGEDGRVSYTQRDKDIAVEGIKRDAWDQSESA